MDMVAVVVGGLIGITGTSLATFLTYYFDERREDRTRKSQDWNKVRDEVYSPLIFDLQSIRDWGTLQELRVIGRTIPALLEKYSTEQVASSLTSILKFANYGQSQRLEDILRKNTRLIRPSTLWSDLAMFCDNLKHIEKILAIISTGFLEESPDKLVSALRGLAQIGVELDDASQHLIIETRKIALMDKPAKSLDYRVFFTETVRKNLANELDKFPVFLPKGD